MSRTQTLTSPPREGEPAGTVDYDKTFTAQLLVCFGHVGLVTCLTKANSTMWMDVDYLENYHRNGHWGAQDSTLLLICFVLRVIPLPIPELATVASRKQQQIDQQQQRKPLEEDLY